MPDYNDRENVTPPYRFAISDQVTLVAESSGGAFRACVD